MATNPHSTPGESVDKDEFLISQHTDNHGFKLRPERMGIADSMDKLGVLIVSKSLSSSAIIDTLLRSEKYSPDFYVVERQENPLNLSRAKVHQVVPDLNIAEIARFARKHKKELAFGLTDTEDFVTAGGRDIIETETGVQMICVTQKYAVERSKADQRILFDEIWPQANPRYRIFDPEEYRGEEAAITDLKRLASEVDGIVIKPDAPARGAGVGVWGSDFRTENQMVAFFHDVFSKGRVVVEERVEGEESSFQAFSDGRHMIPAPLTRDYKRALDNNKGKLTGGMGSYRGPESWLPFIRASEWETIVEAERRAFRRWKGRGSNPDLRGIVLYDALMHTRDGFKVLERNSRGGNTEQVNILTTMLDDFVDVCYRMIDGTLKGIRFSNNASVVTCAVPLAYGVHGADQEKHEGIALDAAYRLEKRYDGKLRIFPMDVRSKDGLTYLGTSRSLAVAGIGRSVEDAREISLKGIRTLDGLLRNRSDIASESDIAGSRNHLRDLRKSRA